MNIFFSRKKTLHTGGKKEGLRLSAALLISIGMLGAHSPAHALTLKAELKDGQGIQTRINLTLVSRDGEKLKLYSFKHTENYGSLLKSRHSAVTATLTHNIWGGDADRQGLQQVTYPGFQLIPSSGGGEKSLEAVANKGACHLPLTLSNIRADQTQGTLDATLIPEQGFSPACLRAFPKLQEIQVHIQPQAYEYHVPHSHNVPALFFLKGHDFNISPDPKLAPASLKDLGIYRYTMSVLGRRIDEKPAPGVHLAPQDLLTRATVFSGFALWGKQGFSNAVQTKNMAWLISWLKDLAVSKPYYSDGIVYRNLRGQHVQWVYYPSPDGQHFEVSEMTFLSSGELEELCHYPLNFKTATFSENPANPSILLNYAAPNLKETGQCANIPLASYPDALQIMLTPEVTTLPQIRQILGLK